jgi:hypothetical protein
MRSSCCSGAPAWVSWTGGAEGVQCFVTAQCEFVCDLASTGILCSCSAVLVGHLSYVNAIDRQAWPGCGH